MVIRHTVAAHEEPQFLMTSPNLLAKFTWSWTSLFSEFQPNSGLEGFHGARKMIQWIAFLFSSKSNFWCFHLVQQKSRLALLHA